VRPKGVSSKAPKRPLGKKRPLALAAQGELSTGVDRSEEEGEDDESGVIGESSGDVSRLRSLLRHHKLEHFEAAIHRAGVLSLAQLASVADSVLMSSSVGLRKVHIRKLQEESRTRVFAARQNAAQDIGRRSSSGTPDLDQSAVTQDDAMASSPPSIAATDPLQRAQLQPLSPPRPPPGVRRVGRQSSGAVSTTLDEKSVRDTAVAALPQAPLQLNHGDAQNGNIGTMV